MVLLLLTYLSLASNTSDGYITPLSYPGYTLVWHDEFSGKTLNHNYWTQQIGNDDDGWGNGELEYYTDGTRNVSVSHGSLIIEARKEPFKGLNYTSGRITTKGKKTFTFGRIDIRAKLPVGIGMWPALWMLGTRGDWPSCGELDIMELIGDYPNRVRGSLHWQNKSGAHTHKWADFFLQTGNFSDKFHVFSINWKRDKIQWYVDDKLVLTLSKADFGGANYPFNDPMFFVFNVAAGGFWPGPPSNTIFPQRMYVDYVRVFQRSKP